MDNPNSIDNPSSIDVTLRHLITHLATAEAQVTRLKAEIAEAERQQAIHQAQAQERAKQPQKSTSTYQARDQNHYAQSQAQEMHFGRGGLDSGLPDDWQNEFLLAVEQLRHVPSTTGDSTNAHSTYPLSHQDYQRYGRQLILPEIGLPGQLRLKSARVCIIGLGGLGSPAAAYLVGAGVGTIGLVDGDTVEVSNLHRQTLHSEGRVGMSKVASAMCALNGINSSVTLVPHKERLSPEHALSILSSYDLVLDCTDTPATRYLISDTCVLLRLPLISASALKLEGQLMLLNHPPSAPGMSTGGPCYRCIFPRPPPANSVLTCGEGGILGPVVGTMGVLQALEAIKLLTQTAQTTTEEDEDAIPMELDDLVAAEERIQNRDSKGERKEMAEPPSMLLFSAYSKPMFRSLRMRTRRKGCAACGETPSVTREALESGSLDYASFCGIADAVDVLSAEERVSARRLKEMLQQHDQGQGENGEGEEARPVIVDVREKVQFELCSLPESINVPFSGIQRRDAGVAAVLRGIPEKAPIYVVCRLGNDSQVAVRRFKQLGLDGSGGAAGGSGRGGGGGGGARFIGDIIGGLKAWRSEIDPDFPEY